MISTSVTGTLPEINTDFSEAMKEIRELMYKSVMQNFASSGRPSWPPRTKSYPWPMLRKSDTMYNAITRESDMTSATVFVPDSIRYAVYVHSGTRKMPPRPFMMFQDEDYEAILNILAKHLYKGSISLTGPTSQPRSLQ